MEPGKKSSLLYGIIISTLFFVVLFTIRISCPILLDIDSKWLIVAGIPLLVSLIVGNFVKAFKGWGVELELVNTPIFSDDSVVAHIKYVSVKDKQELHLLPHLDEKTKTETNVLRFVRGRRGYYTDEALVAYIRFIPNIEFLEVVNRDGSFWGLIDIRPRKAELTSEQNPQLRKALLDLIVSGVPGVDNEFSLVVITSSIESSQTILKAYKKIKELGCDILPVVSQERRLIGIVYRQKLAESIASQVLRVSKSNIDG